MIGTQFTEDLIIITTLWEILRLSLEKLSKIKFLMLKEVQINTTAAFQKLCDNVSFQILIQSTGKLGSKKETLMKRGAVFLRFPIK